MQITDINGLYIKIGKTSITVKDENNKTKGIITNCIIINKNTSPRILFEYSSRFRKANASLMYFYDNLVLKDGNLYFLYSLNLNDFYNKYAVAGREEFFETELKHINKQNELKAVAKSMGITVVECRL